MDGMLTAEATLPADGLDGTLVGRAQTEAGPSVVAIREDGVFDLSAVAPTMSDLLDQDDPVAIARSEGTQIGALSAILANSAHDRREPGTPWFLAPIDLQAIKASGVTFAKSMLERVIEEQARGDAAKSRGNPQDHRLRDRLRSLEDRARLGRRHAPQGPPDRPGGLVPISGGGHRSGRRNLHQGPAHGRGRHRLPDRHPPGQLLEQPRAGAGRRRRQPTEKSRAPPSATTSICAISKGRSALLLGKSKDNNASTALGPFIRLLDDTLDPGSASEQTTITLRVEGQ